MYNYFKQHPDITVNIKKPLKLAHLEKSEEALALYRTFFRPQPDPSPERDGSAREGPDAA